MWFLLWLAWCWFVTPSRSVDARCGQLQFCYHVLRSSVGVPTPLAAFLADFGDADFRCRFPCDALWLFRSHALLVSVGVSLLLAALLLTDFGRRLLILSFANLLHPLVEILSCFLLPLCLCFGGPLHPSPMPCSRAWHGAFPRPFWPCPFLIRGWRMLDCLRIPLLCIQACLVCSLGNLKRTRPPGCVFLRPVPPLLGPSVLGDSRSQGCAAKAHCAAKAPRAGSVCAVLGGSRNLGCAAKAHRAVYGPLCWLVRAPCPSWRPPAHLWPPFVDAEVPPLSPAPSVASSPPASASAAVASVPAPAASDVAASVPVSAPATSDAAASDVPVTAGCVAAGSAPHSTGLDDVIGEAADALLCDVASSILGQVSASSAVPATVVSTLAACSSPLPPVSRPASTCARRLSMPPVPEQDDFEAWYAAQVQAASKAPPPPPFSAGLSSRPAPSRPNKRAASNSDPSRVKRSRPATRTSQAGMSS
ncbi:hypothetical protein V6N12_062319 [Hibiscus sabdariffa]|uniref:Uncharacterized protein n=1 Tax=Hibiscus sabdariffa TaxID=183260 RepID=A0ABR2F8M4_9ROSI